VHDLYIAEIYRPGTIFFSADSVGLSPFACTQRATEKNYVALDVVFCRSRSLKIIEIGTNRKPTYDFLLVFHCDYMPIFYGFRDLTIYWLKICVFDVFIHSNLV